MTRTPPSGARLRAITRREAAHTPEPDPARLARAVATAYLEVEAGRRPLRQLDPLLAPALRLRLHGTGRRPVHPYGPDAGAVLRVRTDHPTADTVDAAVVVRRGQRVGALTVRFERHRGAWRITEIGRPEADMPAARTASLPTAPPLPDSFDATEDPPHRRR